ncbi:MAG TPA: nucleoside triphosphate pyrophosphohydrolase family protein [Candidatus Saccharimonadales bacterium]|jgi:NTP pyrophosphatase (non-canonical NTP hydrolase)|nr:nucleoside triphosphate pyrophosphohydrolase family protein [Candidatus Saccharimonadales bacterium]
MTFDEYQKRALTTVISSEDSFKDTLHWVLGINGEAGEVAEKVKKIIRDKNGILTDEDRKELAKEIGDVLWYLAVFAHSLGFSFDAIALANLKKLQSRQARGALGGSGDNR